MIKYILFDVSGTLLYKPKVLNNIQNILISNGYDVNFHELKLRHKILTETVFFPDRTDEKFYNKFNSELLYSLGIIPNSKLLDTIFSSCTYLPWDKYEDTHILKNLKTPIGVISNFNSTLKNKLLHFFGDIFSDIFVSEEIGIAKPEIGFYNKAIENLGFNPKEILYIGDSLKLDIEPATSLGLKSLLIDRDGFYLSSPFVITSLKEILNYSQ